jgi:hypothetical protein
MTDIPDELRQILETTPPEEVIAKIEALDPPWKHDFLPWQSAQPGEEIPWYAVYSLTQKPLTDESIKWAYTRLCELGWLKEDA